MSEKPHDALGPLDDGFYQQGSFEFTRENLIAARDACVECANALRDIQGEIADSYGRFATWHSDDAFDEFLERAQAASRLIADYAQKAWHRLSEDILDELRRVAVSSGEKTPEHAVGGSWHEHAAMQAKAASQIWPAADRVFQTRGDQISDGNLASICSMWTQFDNGDALTRRIKTEAALAMPPIPSGGDSPDVFVTAKMIAGIVHLEDRSIGIYRKDWPEPDIPNAGRQPAQWKYSRIRPVLVKQFPKRNIPESLT